MGAFTSSPLSAPFPGSAAAAAFGGATTFGFEIPQGSVGELEAAAGRAAGASMAFDSHAQDVKRAVGAAQSGWEGSAESAFASYAGHLIGVFSSNSQVLGRAGELLSSFAKELEHAQQVTRQAAAQCAHYQGELRTQQGLAQQHGQSAQQLSMQASLAPHPHARAQLTGQAKEAAAQAQAAAQAASRAEGEFKVWQKRGRDADTAYSHQAAATAQEISGLEGQLKTPQLLHGGVPVPIAVSQGDIKFALGAMPAASAIPGSAWSDNPGGALRKLTGGRAVTPSEVAALYQVAKEHRSEPQGSIIDGLGGLVTGTTGGLVSFGNPNTARFHGGQIASVVIAINPESLITDGERLGARLVEEGSASSDAGRVIRYGDQPSPRPPGTQAHHIFQDRAFQGVAGYRSKDAPSLLIDQESHLKATLSQRRAVVGGTYGAERQVAIDALIQAGMHPIEARRIVAASERYFTDTLGLTEKSPLEIPYRPGLR